MRSMWNGHISFGLVNIPVKLYGATSREDLSFRFLHKKDLSPISYEKVCAREGEEVPWDEIVRGYEYEKGKFVVLTDEDFKRADVEATRTIDILDFVEASEVDMMYFDKPYWLQPGRGGEKPYVLLREALARTGKIGIAKVVIRTRQHLAAVKPAGNALVLNLMRFQDELADPAGLELPEDADLDRREITMAERLIENLTAPFDPAKYTDDYRRELMALIREKMEGREPEPVEEGRPSPQVIDIMTALKASLEKTERESKRKGSRSGGGGSARSRGGKAPARSGTRRSAGRGNGGDKAAGGTGGGRKRPAAREERRRKAS